MRPRLPLLVSTWVLVAACDLAHLYSTAPGDDDSPFDGGRRDAAPDRLASDGVVIGGDLDGGEAAVVPGDCPGTGGPPGVRIPGTAACVDRTEVTYDQYQQFLAAKAGDTSGQIAVCSWNTSFQPTPGTGVLPVAGVDWCDAYAFCRWAGKRLCGTMPKANVPGGALTGANYADTIENQWLNACTSSGSNKYVYGMTYVAGNCADYNTGNVVKEVASLPKCRNAAGHYDMNGNLNEFVDRCDGDASDSQCLIFGGMYGAGDVDAGAYPAPSYTCSIAFTVARTFRSPDLGFRCCSP